MTSDPTQAKRKPIASLQRALDILDLFSNERGELGIAEIARLVHLPVGTASGLVYTLKLNHYLDQDAASRKYRLGLKFAERASVLLNQLDLRKIAAPFLEELRDWCGESINLAIRDGDEVVYIERLFGNHALGIRSELGRRGALHSTALGKAICAFLPAAELDTLLARYHFAAVTPYSITTRAAFEAELEAVRTRRYAIDEQENELGGRCVGAALFDHTGRPAAAISISVPIQRFADDAVEAYGRRLLQTAGEISMKLGYPPA